jgi:hypothetical protein
MTRLQSMVKAHGSMRRRGWDSWELRVYQDRQNHQSAAMDHQDRTRDATLRPSPARGSRRRGRKRTDSRQARSPICWSSGSMRPRRAWAAPTVSHTRSIIDCHLKPDLGHLGVVKLTTEDIDDYYGHLLRRGGRDGRPLAPGTVTRIHGVLHRALAQAVRWDWIWSNPATNAMPVGVRNSDHPVTCGFARAGGQRRANRALSRARAKHLPRTECG